MMTIYVTLTIQGRFICLVYYLASLVRAAWSRLAQVQDVLISYSMRQEAS